VPDPVDPRALPRAVVADVVRTAPLPVLQLFGPAEAHVAAAAAAPSLRHASGELRRLLALGGVIAAAGGDVVGPDQGATHVLAAAGAACSVLFGAQDPLRTAPVGARALVRPDPPACAPCRQRRCTHAQGPVCMQFAPEAGRVVPTGWPAG
jgi:ADP-heptose:LPS heptosyltransferase